jgi:hypothetical protein
VPKETPWKTVGHGMIHLHIVANFNDVQSSSLSSCNVGGTRIRLVFGNTQASHWFSQANRIFRHLGISSHFENYGTNSNSSWSAIEVDLPRQFYWTMFSFASAFPRLQQTHSKASCFSAHPRIFKLDHLRSNGQTAQHIGHWIHSVPIHLAWKMQLI